MIDKVGDFPYNSHVKKQGVNMKFYRKDLIQQANVPIHFEEEITYDLSQFQKNHSSLRELKDVTVSGVINYDQQLDTVIVTTHATGTMVVACSITNEDVDYEFEANLDEVYSFVSVSQDDDMIEVDGDVLDLAPFIFQSILFEVPLYIVKPGIKEYPKGDGWEILSEPELQAQEKPLDPRLAKLREFKVEE